MSPALILTFVFAYFVVLIAISLFTGKSVDNDSFFTGNRKSPWYVVAFGMIGASLSGVTFISVPGWVATSQFSYMQVVLGYLVGYSVIALILLPLYYKLNLVSIYTYLEQRFGFFSYKTGAGFFLISRLIGSAFRLYLVAIVFQFSIFDQLDISVPFWVTVSLTILLIWIYTFKGGIKTIIWTDTLQTLFMLIAVIATIVAISSQINLDFLGLVEKVSESSYSKMFFFDDWKDKQFFVKQFLSGVFISIVMTGLDQDMMQKNLTCKSIGEAQKNMFSFSIVLVFVNLFFLVLGALLYLFATEKGIALPEKSDALFPMLALGGYLSPAIGVFFILGLIAAAYSSADSALTALTTSFCVDILGISKKEKLPQTNIRKRVHIFISVCLALVIILFKEINNDSVISELFTIAGYTYGPLLGLFTFGLFTKISVKDKFVPFVCIISPIMCYFLKYYANALFGYQFNFELLIINGAFTFIGLLMLKSRTNTL